MVQSEEVMGERGGSQVQQESNGTRLKHGILTPTTDNSGPSSDGPIKSKSQRKEYAKITPCVSLGKPFIITVSQTSFTRVFHD
jgi:hypothetical protein